MESDERFRVLPMEVEDTRRAEGSTIPESRVVAYAIASLGVLWKVF